MASTKPKKSTKKPAAPPKKKPAAASTRTRKAPAYRHFRLQKKIHHPKGRPAGVRVLLRRAGKLMLSTWKPVLALTIIYTLFQLLLVHGLKAPLDVVEFKDTLSELFEGDLDNLSAATATLSALFGSQNEVVGEGASTYGALALLFFSMAFVWVYRQKTAGNKFTTLQAIYRSPYPITVILGVLFVIALQALPFAIGSILFSTVMQGEIAVGAYEKTVWWIFLGLTALLSFYLISSSVFALYISTLPDMTPMKALRSARNLVRYRRFSVMSRILAAALIVIIAAAGVLLPLIFFAAPIAGWVYFAMSALVLPAVHAFGYTLYRELL